MGSYVKSMKCNRCGKEYAPESAKTRCDNLDDGRLDLFYDYEKIKELLSPTILSKRAKGVWRYSELLPIDDRRHIITLWEGGTPLIATRRLGEVLGLSNLMVLDETRNPTASYKDRGMTVAVSKAVEQGAKKTVTASSGNAAAALAAYSAAAGLQCVTFVEEVTTVGKLAQLSLYGANVIRVAGLESGEDPAVKMLRAACDNYHFYPCPSMGPFNPYQIEGPKTMSYEIVEQSGWTVPDWVFVPAGGGSGIGGNWKGYEDFTQLGFISSVPKMVVVQSTGCAPIVRAYEQNMDPLRIVPWERPDSVATGLMDPYPWDGDLALHAIKKSHGQAIAVSNEEILHAQQQLAKYAGIFAEPSGATSLAGAINLLTAGRIDKSDHVVVEITGSGLKDPEIVMKSMPNIPLIKPSLEELRTVIKN